MNFEKVLGATQKSLKEALYKELIKHGYTPTIGEKYLYAEGDTPVMLVAHLDTVHKSVPLVICVDKTQNIYMSPQGIGGDDRCGVFMIMEIIKSHKCHVLFCEDEELGGIGATDFTESKINPDVDFIIELDRRGSRDAVFYGCDNLSFIEFITEHGFVEEYGTFSDISIIAPHLGIAAVNLSCGYRNEHTKYEYISKNVMMANIEKVKKIIDASPGFFKYIPTHTRVTYYRAAKTYSSIPASYPKDYSYYTDDCVGYGIEEDEEDDYDDMTSLYEIFDIEDAGEDLWTDMSEEDRKEEDILLQTIFTDIQRLDDKTLVALEIKMAAESSADAKIKVCKEFWDKYCKPTYKQW